MNCSGEARILCGGRCLVDPEVRDLSGKATNGVPDYIPVDKPLAIYGSWSTPLISTINK